MDAQAQSGLPDFSDLTPDTVLHVVETALGRRCSNLCRPLNSYINRVYEVQLDDESWRIVKFYRPGRWSREALQDEQDFLLELVEHDIPAVPPLAGAGGATLQDYHGIFFALFPKKGGRVCDEPTPSQWMELGRLLARMHLVGAAHLPRNRIEISPRQSSIRHLQFILESDSVVAEHRDRYERTVHEVLDLIAPLFVGAQKIRIHGDCHSGNILHRPGEPFHLIDFDDMAVGPPVQDLWMMLPGHLKHCQPEVELLLEGYETFRPLDHRSLRLIEPLRFMRFVHYTAWCARQKADGGFARLAPGWGAGAFWKQEIHDLEQQRREILDALEEGDALA